jgi:hypothetical protein
MTEVRYWVYTTTEHMETLDQIRLALAAERPLVVLQKYPTRAGQTRRPLPQPANTDGNRFIDSAGGRFVPAVPAPKASRGLPKGTPVGCPVVVPSKVSVAAN